MDTKERKTPVQDSCPAPGLSPLGPKLAPSTAVSGKNRIRKTEPGFKSLPKNFFRSPALVNSGFKKIAQPASASPNRRISRWRAVLHFSGT